jgi:hypothetical protein
MENRVMKTNITLGKSVKNLMFKSIGVSLLTSTHYLVSDSVNGSVYYLVDDSLTISIRDSTRWNIRL